MMRFLLIAALVLLAAGCGGAAAQQDKASAASSSAKPASAAKEKPEKAQPRSPSEEIPPAASQLQGRSRAAHEAAAPAPQADEVDQTTSRAYRRLLLVSGISIFVLAVFVGFEVISKVPATLHTPLMSGSNAISGITIVGSIIAASAGYTFASFLGFLAVILAMVNVVGGFLVTHRMLLMFKRR
jgi:NAD(P) transhydrogenase subunit alpha